MRRVYEIKGKATRASGLLAWFVRGRSVDGFLIVDGSEEDFRDVVGCTFGVTGELVDAPLMGRIPMKARGFGRVEVQVDSRSHHSKLVFPDVTLSVLVDISDDGRALDRIEVDGSPTTLGRIMLLSGVTIRGTGKMSSETL